MKKTETNCPNCGAPWNVYHRECNYCKTAMPEPAEKYDIDWNMNHITTTTGTNWVYKEQDLDWDQKPLPMHNVAE